MLRRSGERAALPPAPLSRARGRRGSRGSCCRPSATDKDGEQGGGGGKAAQPRELRRRPAHGEGSDGRKDARGAAGHRGGALLQRTDAPAQVYSGWPARVHAHTHRLTLTPSAPGSHARGFRESGRDLTPRHPTHTHPHPRRILPSADPAASAQAAARLGGPTAAESRPRRPDPFPAGRATLPPAPHLIPDADGAGGGGNEGNLPRLVPSRPTAASPAVTRTHLTPPPRPGAARRRTGPAAVPAAKMAEGAKGGGEGRRSEPPLCRLRRPILPPPPR